jgi:anaerobic selenocysteine-containing dehydrogenase
MPRVTRPRKTHVTVETACPLDCPDSCSLAITVDRGRIVEIDGSDQQPLTGGYICGKVRRFGERLYGDARLRHPGIRIAPKGTGSFAQVDWPEALDQATEHIREVVARWGGEAVLPVSYGGSNGLLSQDTIDARLFRRLGSSRLARTVCAAPTGAALRQMYGGMPSVTYGDYVHARLIVIWGANSSTSGIHLVPHVREAQRRGAKLVVIDPRTTQLARLADLHLPVRPGTDLAVALAVHRFLFENGRHDTAFLGAHARGADRLAARAAEWTFERAADVAGLDRSALERFAALYAEISPAVIRCGWGLERNRNGGNAALAVLALPAVAGKFGVRGGGFTMSNSGAWPLERTWIGAEEQATRIVNMNRLGRALTEMDSPPLKVLFVYNCNPAVTLPDQNRVLKGLARKDLYTIVFDQVLTDTARYADLVLPATTFLESHDIARGYGPTSLQLIKPVVEGPGQVRSNPDVFAELSERLGFTREGEPDGELAMLMSLTAALPPATSNALWGQGIAFPACGAAPVQFVDVDPGTSDGMIDLFPEELDREAPSGLYRWIPETASDLYPLALISPASDRTISSTLGELPRPAVKLLMHPEDAGRRTLEENDKVRVFNEIGEVHCALGIGETVRPGTVVLPKGLWRKDTLNGSTATALAPDSLTDFAGGACFNDARVQVERLPD